MGRDALKIQCKAKSKRSGERCRRWAVNGALVCAMHGAGGRNKPQPSSGALGAEVRLADADAQLRARLWELREKAIEAVEGVLDDDMAKPEAKLRAADTVLDRFVPKKTETKMTVTQTDAADLDEEIMEIIGISPEDEVI